MTWDNSCLDNLLLQLQLFDSISYYFQQVQEFILNKDPTLLDNFLDVSKRELKSTFYKFVIIWIVRRFAFHASFTFIMLFFTHRKSLCSSKTDRLTFDDLWLDLLKKHGKKMRNKQCFVKSKKRWTVNL